MKVKVIEVTNGFNYGKFCVGRFDEEWFLQSKLVLDPDIALPGPRALLGQLGWHSDHTWVLDLQTGEGAFFWPVGSAHHDLLKHQVWVCPMFEPFLTWLYTQNLDDVHALPDLVELTEDEAPSALQGYRRPGPQVAELLAAITERRAVLDAELVKSKRQGRMVALYAQSDALLRVERFLNEGIPLDANPFDAEED